MSSDFVVHILGYNFALHTVPTPTVTISPPSPIQAVMVGNPQDITCIVTTVSGVASSSVMISWMRSGGYSIMSDIRVASSLNIFSNNIYTNRLQFAYLMEGDEDTYACSVRILDISITQPVTIETLSGMYHSRTHLICLLTILFDIAY